MKIVLIEEWGLYRAALKRLVGDLSGDIDCLDVGDIEDLAELPRADLADGLILYSTHGGASLLAEIDALRQQVGEAPIVLLSESLDSTLVAKAVDAGVRGFIPKSANGRVLVSALNLVASGEVFIPATVLHGLEERAQAATLHAARRRLNGPLAGLSNRQAEVLSLLVGGRSNHAIADELGIEETTVKNHVQAILRALRVQNRTQAVLVAVKAGITPMAIVPSRPPVAETHH